MWEVTKSFRFEAAHSLSNTNFGAAGEEIHGHSFRAEVVIRGTPDRETGMLVDLGVLESRLDSVRTSLGHPGSDDAPECSQRAWPHCPAWLKQRRFSSWRSIATSRRRTTRTATFGRVF